MKASVLAVLLVVLAVAGSAMAATCTPSTCQGPVIMSFTNAHCNASDGEIVFSSLFDEGEQLDECLSQGGGYYTKYTCGQFFQSMTYIDSQCQQAAYGTARGIGACVVSGSTSHTYLCNVNVTTITAEGGNPNADVPAYQATYEHCAGPHNCSENIGSYTTYYTSSDCAAVNATASYGSAYINSTFGDCTYYYAGQANIQSFCTGDMVATAYFQDGSPCSGLPYITYLQSTECIPAIPTKRADDTYQTVTCPGGAPSGVNPFSSPDASPSSASALYVSSLALALTFALALVF